MKRDSGDGCKCLGSVDVQDGVTESCSMRQLIKTSPMLYVLECCNLSVQ